MSKYWLDYVKHCYELVIESESANNILLEHEVEAHVVHLMANNFERTNIGDTAVAIKILQAVNSKKSSAELISVADECLLIHSFPLKKHLWPSATYYHDIGTTAYGMASHVMENHFVPASRVLNSIFQHKISL